MANKALTPEQFLTTVGFYKMLCEADDAIFEGVNTNRRQAMGAVLALMGYVMVNGVHVRKETYAQTSYPFGTRPEFKDELQADIEEAKNEVTDNDTRGPETDSGESTESPPVRQTVFRKDV